MKNVKNMKRVIAAAVLMVGFATNSNAQSAATASTTAVLVAPLKIEKTTDMHFGIVGASATAGTISLDYLNMPTAADGAAVIDATDAKTAVFTVTGEEDESFSIALTVTEFLLTNTTGIGGETIEVDGIECQEGTSTLLDAGTKLLYVKATLNIPANAVGGVYTNADELEVTVAYN